ncbi:hypothetical protein C5D44_14515 [Rathayibacter sp. AY1B5]|nr:hypothetical protein C5D44_14515 [Rathayibacter sp. AY1B5]
MVSVQQTTESRVLDDRTRGEGKSHEQAIGSGATAARRDLGTHVTDRGASLVARFPDSSLGIDATGTVSGFPPIEGEDVAADVLVQLLS